MKISDHFNRVLIDKTVIGLALCRMDGELVYVNEAYCQLIGRSIKETLALSYWQITPEKYESQELEQLTSLQNTGMYGPYEKDYIHADGHLIPVRLSGQIVELNGEAYIWSSIEDISDRNQAEAKLEQLYHEMEKLSLQDGLTGIANRRMFDLSLIKEWKRAQRDGSALSLIIFDIDYFKQYNDHYGHVKGDQCLKKIATALSQVSKRGVDLLCRYGGEEFVLLLPETDNTQAINLAKQCSCSVEKQKIQHERSLVSGILTVSAGISTFTQSDDFSELVLVELADKLLYQAKHNGRNRFEYQITSYKTIHFKNNSNKLNFERSLIGYDLIY